MSTLQVANLHFTTTGDQRIEYTGNNVIRVQGKGLVLPRVDAANTPSPEPGMLMYNTTTDNMVMMGNGGAGLVIPSNTTVEAAFTVANASFGKSNTAVQNTSSAIFVGSSNNSSFLNGSSPASYRLVADGQVMPTGTKQTFQQSTAPTGWTKVTTYDDCAMRIVSGSVANRTNGVAFTTAFQSQAVSGSVSTSVSGTVGSTTLDSSMMPAHTHTAYAPVHSQNDAGSQGYPNNDNHQSFRTSDRARDRAVASAAIQTVGGGGSHNHSFGGSASSSFTGTSINMSVNYVDFILATAN